MVAILAACRGRDRVPNSETSSLANIALLAHLKRAELIELEKVCTWKRFATHEQIIDRHNPSRDICFVVEGHVRIANFSLSGREITLDELNAGAHFGELAAIDGFPRSASAVALSECLIAMLSPSRFEELCISHPRVALDVMNSMATIIRSATERIMDLSTLAANNRVHAELLRQARLVMNGDNQAEISPIPVHADMASRVSTTRETVARVMNDLARQNIVTRGKNSLTVTDVEMLEDMVEEVKGE